MNNKKGLFSPIPGITFPWHNSALRRMCQSGYKSRFFPSGSVVFPFFNRPFVLTTCAIYSRKCPVFLFIVPFVHNTFPFLAGSGSAASLTNLFTEFCRRRIPRINRTLRNTDFFHNQLFYSVLFFRTGCPCVLLRLRFFLLPFRSNILLLMFRRMFYMFQSQIFSFLFPLFPCFILCLHYTL